MKIYLVASFLSAMIAIQALVNAHDDHLWPDLKTETDNEYGGTDKAKDQGRKDDDHPHHTPRSHNDKTQSHTKYVTESTPGWHCHTLKPPAIGTVCGPGDGSSHPHDDNKKQTKRKAVLDDHSDWECHELKPSAIGTFCGPVDPTEDRLDNKKWSSQDPLEAAKSNDDGPNDYDGYWWSHWFSGNDDGTQDEHRNDAPTKDDCEWLWGLFSSDCSTPVYEKKESSTKTVLDENPNGDNKSDDDSNDPPHPHHTRPFDDPVRVKIILRRGD